MTSTGQPRLAPIAASHINTAHLRNISISTSTDPNGSRPSFSNRPSSRSQANQISSPPSTAQTLPPDLPLYLLHGFRWPRALIRIHVIVNNLEDAAPDYTMVSSSNDAIMKSFHKSHPELAARLPGLKMVEEYDPNDEDGDRGVSEDGAWVADCVIKLNDPDALQKLQQKGHARQSSSADGKANRKYNRNAPTIDQVMANGITSDAWSAIAELRDELADGAEIGWWIVFNGDPERLGDLGENAAGKDETSDKARPKSSSAGASPEKEKTPSGFRKFFKRSSSTKENGS